MILDLSERHVQNDAIPQIAKHPAYDPPVSNPNFNEQRFRNDTFWNIRGLSQMTRDLAQSDAAPTVGAASESQSLEAC